ncbi:unnamed protein product [Nezara viridula]|uniref:Uncharacterized protein n=1 Tax=Nezara viridula TaxID=85310 RepID=A0A9P0E935_NEZVI|nr:unnamed protein product [Nezara viridula]
MQTNQPSSTQLLSIGICAMDDRIIIDVGLTAALMYLYSRLEILEENNRRLEILEENNRRLEILEENNRRIQRRRVMKTNQNYTRRPLPKKKMNSTREDMRPTKNKLEEERLELANKRLCHNYGVLLDQRLNLLPLPERHMYMKEITEIILKYERKVSNKSNQCSSPVPSSSNNLNI